MSRHRRDTVISCCLSGLLHAGLVAAMVWQTVPAGWARAVPEVSTSMRSSAVTTPVDEPPPMGGVETAEPQQAAADETTTSAAGSDALADVDASDPQFAAMVRTQLERAREDAKTLTDEGQLAELEALGRRLSNVSSQEAVTDVADMLAPVLGVNTSRATQPREHVDDAQPFDVTTAQIFNVRKQEKDGAIQYVAVMVDAVGRSQPMPLDAADGESLYDMFQLMKKFPLLETVYRKTVMGLLDRLLEQERETAHPVDSSEDRSDPARSDEQEQKD